MRLLLIRHGQTPHNVAGALDTAHPGAGLTALGRRQADAVPGALPQERVAAVYASPRLRAGLTAGPLARACDLPVVVEDGLEEISAGDLEMRADHEATRAYAACLESWMRRDLDVAMPGGATGKEFLVRFSGAIARIAARHADNATVTVFSHGAAIRVFATLAAGLRPEVAEDLRIMNTGMVVLGGSPAAGWTLVEWHVEPLGGAALRDLAAHDVTGESADEVAHEADETDETTGTHDDR